MRRFHLWVGALATVAFLVTGQVMRHHNPSLDTLGDGVRLMFRSRHIYLLGSALVNLMLGLYMQRRAGAGPAIVQNIGSGLLLIAPVFLLLAFAFEPGIGFREEMAWSRAGLYSLLAGCVLHCASARSS